MFCVKSIGYLYEIIIKCNCSLVGKYSFIIKFRMEGIILLLLIFPVSFLIMFLVVLVLFLDEEIKVS